MGKPFAATALSEGRRHHQEAHRGHRRLCRDRSVERTQRRTQRQDSHDHAALVRLPQRHQPHRPHHPLLRRHQPSAGAQVTFTLPLNCSETEKKEWRYVAPRPPVATTEPDRTDVPGDTGTNGNHSAVSTVTTVTTNITTHIDSAYR